MVSNINISYLLVLYFFLSTTIIVFGRSIFIVLIIVSTIIVLFFLSRRQNTSRDLMLTVFIALSAALLLVLFGANSVGLSISIISLLALLMMPKDLILLSFYRVKFIFAFLLIPGILIWLVHIITGNFDILRLGLLPDSFISDLKREGGIQYVLYPFSVRIIHPVLIEFMPSVYRFQSIFDEPGYLGTVAAFILAAQGRLKMDFSNTIILFAGVISLSLAFYVLFFLFIFFTYVRSFYGIVLSIIFVGFGFYAAFLFIPGFELLISNRLQFSDGGLVGDNRNSDYVNSLFVIWLSGENLAEFLFGLDFVYDGSTSAKLIALRGGFLGVLLSIFFYFCLYLKYGTRSLSSVQMAFLVVFFTSFYQRPAILDMALLFILIFVLCSSACELEKDK